MPLLIPLSLLAMSIFLFETAAPLVRSRDGESSRKEYAMYGDSVFPREIIGFRGRPIGALVDDCGYVDATRSS